MILQTFYENTNLDWLDKKAPYQMLSLSSKYILYRPINAHLHNILRYFNALLSFK